MSERKIRSYSIDCNVQDYLRSRALIMRKQDWQFLGKVQNEILIGSGIVICQTALFAMTLWDLERSYQLLEHFTMVNISQNTAYIAYKTNYKHRQVKVFIDLHALGLWDGNWPKIFVTRSMLTRHLFPVANLFLLDFRYSFEIISE